MWKLWAFSKINKLSAVTSYNNLSKYDADFNPVQLLASAKCCWHFASATTSPKPINFFKTYWKHLPASLLFIVQENTEVTVGMADFSSKLHLSDVYCLLPFKPFFFGLLSLFLFYFFNQSLFSWVVGLDDCFGSFSILCVQVRNAITQKSGP